jgi:hypothetical protein
MLIEDQPTLRIIRSTSQQHNRGAARDFFESMRSANITPELAGREHTAFKPTEEEDDERNAIKRSGSMSC